MSARPFNWIALTLVIIGAINLGMVGFFQFDLIAMLFGGVGSWLSRIVYALIGISGIYALSLYSKLDYDTDNARHVG